jgi:hypothetical protein
MTSNLKRAHSKALESGCLFRFSLPPLGCDTVSPGRGLKNNPGKKKYKGSRAVGGIDFYVVKGKIGGEY